VPERETRVPTADGEMTTFVVHPEGEGPIPVAVLYMDAVGYREQLKENARRFASGGFYCLVPDLFYRSGPGLTFDMAKLRADGYQGPEAERLRTVIASVKPDGVVADTEAMLSAVESDSAAGSGPKVCVGYCLGARFALHVAAVCAAEFVAAAGIHPGALVSDQPDSPHRDLGGVRGELYFAFAENDHAATPEMVATFREELERHGVRGEVERVPGTAHGFAMADLPVYDRDAAERHFERTLGLWRRNITHEPATA
jgi:carboxymethylenebutenolidase